MRKEPWDDNGEQEVDRRGKDGNHQQPASIALEVDPVESHQPLRGIRCGGTGLERIKSTPAGPDRTRLDPRTLSLSHILSA